MNGSGTLPTYAGVVDRITTLYMDKDPNPYQNNVLPEPLHANPDMTYALTETDGTAIPAGLQFNAADRTVNIVDTTNDGQLPKVLGNIPTAQQYRLTATDAGISLSVSMDITIRYAYRPEP